MAEESTESASRFSYPQVVSWFMRVRLKIRNNGQSFRTKLYILKNLLNKNYSLPYDNRHELHLWYIVL